MTQAIAPLALNIFIGAHQTRAEARLALQQRGWKYAGGGSFASVWLSPCGTRAVKVTKPDAGAELTYRASQELIGNSALPSYYGRVELANEGYAYEVEALKELGGFDEAYPITQGTREWTRSECNADALDDVVFEVGNRIDYMAALEWFREELGNVSKTELDWDIHEGNLMKRGDAFVLTDAIYCSEQMSYTHWSGGSRHNEIAVKRAAQHRDKDLAEVLEFLGID